MASAPSLSTDNFTDEHAGGTRDRGRARAVLIVGGEKGLLQRWASEDPQPMRLQEGRAGLDGVNVMANISDGQERKERLTACLGQVWQGLKHVAGSGVTGSGRRDAEARTQDSDADDTVGGLGMVAAFALSDRLRERRLGVGGGGQQWLRKVFADHLRDPGEVAGTRDRAARGAGLVRRPEGLELCCRLLHKHLGGRWVHPRG